MTSYFQRASSGPEDRVLVIDDFLKRRCPEWPPYEIIDQAGAHPAAVEKRSKRASSLRRGASGSRGIKLRSLAIVESMDAATET